MSEEKTGWVRVRDFDDLQRQYEGGWKSTLFSGVACALLSRAAFFEIESAGDIPTQSGVLEGPFVRLDAALAAFDEFISQLDVRAETKTQFPPLRAQIEALPDYSVHIAASGVQIFSAEGIENAMLREWLDVSAYRKVMDAQVAEDGDELLAEIVEVTGNVLGDKIISGDVPAVMGFNAAAQRDALLVPKTAVLESLDEVGRRFAGSFQLSLLVGFAQIAVLEADNCASGVPQNQRDAWISTRKKTLTM